jgi:uncharacterized membrane protein
MTLFLIWLTGFIASYINGRLFVRKYQTYHWDNSDFAEELFLAVASWLYFVYIMLIRYDVITQSWLGKKSKI